MIPRYQIAKMKNQLPIDFTVDVNSLLAYTKKVLPTLSNRQAEVFEAIKDLKQATCYEVANYLSNKKGHIISPNIISGRFGELKRSQLIQSAGKKDVNGSKHEIWEVTVF